ncbi:hypothetical protein DPMN_066335 [Dreissena polymorpha]|uniref:Uncharacterized protein n=1 Tax=Dreissena polymorpha TaxID=45954 RepID=A0A9D3YW54_DREPO|nr:hypothetical protein DPMN_066335 [Dreissena polymorpha]
MMEFCEKYSISCSHTIYSITLLGHHLLVVGSGPIQLLDISTGQVCYAFDEVIWASNGSNTNTKINKIRACKVTKKIALACSDTVYHVKIDDGECQAETLHTVCPFVWKYENFDGDQLEMKCNEDVKWDSQGNMYIANSHGVYQFCLINGKFKERALIAMCENCSDEHKKRIVVGHSDSNRLHVYEYKLFAEI